MFLHSLQTALRERFRRLVLFALRVALRINRVQLFGAESECVIHAQSATLARRSPIASCS